MIEKKEAICVRCMHVAVCSHVEEFKALHEVVKALIHSPLFNVAIICSEQKYYGGIPRGTTYETCLDLGNLNNLNRPLYLDPTRLRPPIEGSGKEND